MKTETSAANANSVSDAKTLMLANVTSTESAPMKKDTQKNGLNGSEPINSAQATTRRQKSLNSEESQESLNEPFQKPKNVRELAAQASAVATLVLNGQMDAEQAKPYSSLIRSIAQLMGAEVQRARIAKTEPDLSL
jgi:hypothetical protein